MTFIQGDLVVSQDDELKEFFPNFWHLDKALIYEGQEDTFTVPEQFVTDFATVPSFVQWLIPRTGAWNRAVIVHDYFCDRLAEEYLNPGFYIFDEEFPNPRDADGIFRRILREEGVPFVKRWLIWTGVRYGALFSPSRRYGITRDLPLMALLSILFLPIMLPSTVAIGAGHLIYKAYEGISRGFSRLTRKARK